MICLLDSFGLVRCPNVCRHPCILAAPRHEQNQTYTQQESKTHQSIQHMQGPAVSHLVCS
jgi:hypothetical protein